MIRHIALSLLLAALPALALAQAPVLQGGTQTSGHIPQYANTGGSTAVIMDGGTAAGGVAGVNPSELGITARGTGTPPYVAQGSGPSGTILCTYDAPTNNATGYHALCLSPNVGSKGLIDYSYGGLASPQGLDVVVNGYTALSLSSTGVLSQLLTNGHFFVGNASNLATDVAMSGDCTLANTGAVTCTKLNGVLPGDLYPLDYDANFTTSAGSLTFANIASGTVLGNATGGAAAPTASTVSSLLDRAFSSTQGSLLYRDAAGWAALGPGTSGNVLQSGGPAANPSWSAAVGSGTVTSIATNNGVTGGTITTTGTIGLANIADGQILANTTGGAAPPSGSSSPVLGIDATTAGTIGLANAGVGGDTVTIQNPSTTAGAYNFNLPATAGTSSQLLTSAGGGSSAMTWTSTGTSGATLPFLNGANTWSGVQTLNAKTVEFAEGANVASAAGATDIWAAADGQTIHITGTEAITGFGTAPQAGAMRFVVADGAFTLTNGASLILPSGANITAAAGDTFQVYADTTTVARVLYYQRANGTALVANSGPTLLAAQATTSGTSFDFTVPSTAKQIVVSWIGVSLSGSDNMLIQLGDAGGVETNGYESVSANDDGAGNIVIAASTSGLLMKSGNASYVHSGQMLITLQNASANSWTSGLSDVFNNSIGWGSGAKSLSASITTVRLTRTGTDTFDAGSVAVQYQ